jgi:hypothetical protein
MYVPFRSDGAAFSNEAYFCVRVGPQRHGTILLFRKARVFSPYPLRSSILLLFTKLHRMGKIS